MEPENEVAVPGNEVVGPRNEPRKKVVSLGTRLRSLGTRLRGLGMRLLKQTTQASLRSWYSLMKTTAERHNRGRP